MAISVFKLLNTGMGLQHPIFALGGREGSDRRLEKLSLRGFPI
jgi:hypothetical protein